MPPWEVAGRYGLIAGRAFPPPSAVAADWIANAEVYAIHAATTLRSAALGFLFARPSPFSPASSFAQVPIVERIARGISITLFAVPPITIGPILVILFSGAVPQIILSAMTVYFPTMVATLIGLRDVDPRPIDVVRAYGGGSFAVLRFVRLRAALPSILSGLRVAAPAAMLGAILGEFGAGTRWGLGSFLLGSLGQGDPARIWGIGLAATAMAAVGYIGFGIAGRAALGRTTQVTVAANSAPDRLGAGPALNPAQRVVVSLAALAAPFAVWWLLLKLFGLNPIVARDPIATFDYLFFAERPDWRRRNSSPLSPKRCPPPGSGCCWARRRLRARGTLGVASGDRRRADAALARSADDAAGRPDAHRRADLRARPGGDPRRHGVGRVLSRLRDPRPRARAGPAQRAGRVRTYGERR